MRLGLWLLCGGVVVCVWMLGCAPHAPSQPQDVPAYFTVYDYLGHAHSVHISAQETASKVPAVLLQSPEDENDYVLEFHGQEQRLLRKRDAQLERLFSVTHLMQGYSLQDAQHEVLFSQGDILHLTPEQSYRYSPLALAFFSKEAQTHIANFAFQQIQKTHGSGELGVQRQQLVLLTSLIITIALVMTNPNPKIEKGCGSSSSSNGCSSGSSSSNCLSSGCNSSGCVLKNCNNSQGCFGSSSKCSIQPESEQAPMLPLSWLIWGWLGVQLYRARRRS